MINKLKKVFEVIRRDGFWHTIKRSIAWSIAHSPFAYKLSFPYTKDTKLVFSPALMTYSIFARRDTRHGDVDIIKKYTPVGGTVLDVGGNIGSLTIAAAEHIGASGTVHTFEPSPKFFKIILANVACNEFSERVTTHQVALGASKDTVFLNEAVADDTTNHVAATGTAVPQNTLDSFTTSLSHIDFLKIDVEGYELEVLKGAKETLRKTAVLYIEFIPTQLERAGSDPQAVLHLIAEQFTINTFKNDILSPFVYDSQSNRHPDLLCLKKSV